MADEATLKIILQDDSAAGTSGTGGGGQPPIPPSGPPPGFGDEGEELPRFYRRYPFSIPEGSRFSARRPPTPGTELMVRPPLVPPPLQNVRPASQVAGHITEEAIEGEFTNLTTGASSGAVTRGIASAGAEAAGTAGGIAAAAGGGGAGGGGGGVAVAGGAAGGAAGVGGIASLASLAGPIGIAVAVLLATIPAVVMAFRALAEEAHSLHERFRNINGELAAVEAQNRYRMLFAEQQQARRIAPELVEFEKARTDLQIELMKSIVTIIKPLLPIATDVSKTIAEVLPILSEFIVLMIKMQPEYWIVRLVIAIKDMIREFFGGKKNDDEIDQLIMDFLELPGKGNPKRKPRMHVGPFEDPRRPGPGGMGF